MGQTTTSTSMSRSLTNLRSTATCAASFWPKKAKSGRTTSNNFARSEEHTSELQSLRHLVCRLLLEKQLPVLRPVMDLVSILPFVVPPLVLVVGLLPFLEKITWLFVRPEVLSLIYVIF